LRLDSHNSYDENDVPFVNVAVDLIALYRFYLTFIGTRVAACLYANPSASHIRVSLDNEFDSIERVTTVGELEENIERAARKGGIAKSILQREEQSRNKGTSEGFAEITRDLVERIRESDGRCLIFRAGVPRAPWKRRERTAIPVIDISITTNDRHSSPAADCAFAVDRARNSPAGERESERARERE